jgi:hypothetical protein
MHYKVDPGTGLGNIKFGMRRSEIKKMLGEPSDVESPEEATDLEYWHFDDLDTSFTFDGMEDWRLTAIVSSNNELKLYGLRLIGADRESIVDLLGKKGHKKLSFEEDFEDDVQIETIESESLELMVWLREGTISEVQFGPFFLDEGTISWPEL